MLIVRPGRTGGLTTGRVPGPMGCSGQTRAKSTDLSTSVSAARPPGIRVHSEPVSPVACLFPLCGVRPSWERPWVPLGTAGRKMNTAHLGPCGGVPLRGQAPPSFKGHHEEDRGSRAWRVGAGPGALSAQEKPQGGAGRKDGGSCRTGPSLEDMALEAELPSLPRFPHLCARSSSAWAEGDPRPGCVTLSCVFASLSCFSRPQRGVRGPRPSAPQQEGRWCTHPGEPPGSSSEGQSDCVTHSSTPRHFPKRQRHTATPKRIHSCCPRVGITQMSTSDGETACGLSTQQNPTSHRKEVPRQATRGWTLKTLQMKRGGDRKKNTAQFHSRDVS